MLPSLSSVTPVLGRAADPRCTARSRPRAWPASSSDHSGASLAMCLLAPEHRRLRLAEHLDVAEGIVELGPAEIEVVQAQRLLIAGRVRLLRDGQHRLAVVEHVVAADLVGAVGEAARVLVVGGREQQAGRVGRRRRRPPRSRPGSSRGPVLLDHHLGDRGAGRVGLAAASRARW